MAAWIPQPVMFESGRAFDCEGFDSDQCQYYKHPWRNWYVADWTYALPTIALFMCIIGIFIIGYILTQVLALSHRPEPLIWRRGVALTRYLTYRGFRIESLRWNSAPVGMDLIPSPYYWPGSDTVWGGSPPLGTRSGWLALACMPFVFATATKTNWITLVTGVPYEKLQVFHRWSAYAFLILALMHTFPFIVWHIHNGDMVNQFTVSNIFEYWTGVVALVFQAWLTFASWGPIRDYFVATAAVYVPCWTYPWLRTLFEYGTRQKAEIFIEDNGFTRITILANFKWQPGQHCFLRFRGFGLHALSSHPFTICSLPSTSINKPSELTFYIRHQAGFTARLYSHAMNRPGVQVPVFVDGPYGGIDNQKYFSSGRLIVVAGGSGAGWMLPFVEQFLQYQSSKGFPSLWLTKRKRTKRPLTSHPISEILVAPITAGHTINTRHSDSHMSLGTHISVEVHVTGEAEPMGQPPTKSAPELERSDLSLTEKDIISKHAGASRNSDASDEPKDEVRGRPDLPLIIREESATARATGQTVGVFVCGPLAMQNDVRNAVAKENLSIVKSPSSGGVYLYSEHFSWA
ncbi:ferric reductase transmembrane [Botrytis cinerea]